MTSNFANIQVRKLLQCKGTGFAGTLDPMATGLLPIAVGEATKLLPYVMHKTKTYIFRIKWGEHRDTGDETGSVVHTSDRTPCAHEINTLLPSFHGTILQTPPVYSALKVQGVRACDRMRRGECVTLDARPVHITSYILKEHDISQRASLFQVTCGSGTYVRSLAVDLAASLQAYGYVTMLRRIHVGVFDVQHAFSLASLKELGHSETRRLLLPASVVLDDIPDIVVTEAQALMLWHGQSCPIHAHIPVEGLRVWAHLPHAQHVIAMCDVREGKIWPVRVFRGFFEKG